MKMTRRDFITTTGALAGAAMLTLHAARADKGGSPLSPAINPVFLTGSLDGWPLADLAAIGYRGLELTPACLDNPAPWLAQAEEAGLALFAVNALPDLRPYLTGSLSDAVEHRRRATLDRLLATLRRMRELHVPFLVVAPSRLAENYQSVEEARALLVESLRELAAAGDATILLEGAPFRLFASAAEIAALVDAVASSQVAAALDVGHCLLRGESPADAAKTLGPHLRYVQVHDAEVRCGFPLLDAHLPLGLGAAGRQDVLAAIADRPCAVTVTAPDDPLSAAREALAWLTGQRESPG